MTESLQKLKERGLMGAPPHSSEIVPTSGVTPPSDFFSAIIPGGARLTDSDIKEIPLEELREGKGHMFQVRDDEDMELLVSSIREHGQLEPAIVRTRPEGGYELVSGHRRQRACQLAGKSVLRSIVLAMNDDDAKKAMVEANKYRSWIAPSEKGRIYECEMELYSKRQGERTDLTSATGLPKRRWRDEIGEKWGVSGETVRQYILLISLSPALLYGVDNADKKVRTSKPMDTQSLQIQFKAGVELAVLNPDSQDDLIDFLERCNIRTITKAQAAALRKQFEEEGELTEEAMMGSFGTRPQATAINFARFALPGEALHQSYSHYRNDTALQELMVELINDYIARIEDNI